MFCSAIEKPKVAAEIPRSSVIGRMNRPRLWRSPMHSEMIRPLRRISSSIARRLPGVAMEVSQINYRYTGLCTHDPARALLELVGDLVDAGLDAGLVLL